MNKKFRREKDVLGELEIPINAYWGINTQRAIQNFQISNKTFPRIFITSLAEVKKACLMANLELELIGPDIGKAVLQVLKELLEDGKYHDQFPVDVFQTGSGTQTNMNMNEVLANRANEILGFPLGKKHPVHPNDHINKCQSSNDVIPTTMHISALHMLKQKLIPNLEKIISILNKKVKEYKDIIKVGRTHLQDAVPIPLGLEFEVYLTQIKIQKKRLEQDFQELCNVPLGGTALGTGINAHKDFSSKAVSILSEITGFSIKLNPTLAEGIASHSTLVNLSGTLRLLALALMKMANDIRWMASGPRAGLSELIIPENEPGSSIMPGKVNPTQSEALIQVCLQVFGNDSTISLAEGYGSILDLNVCKPVLIVNLIESIELLTNGINSFTDNCLKELKPNIKQINSQLERMLMIVTNLNPIIGYDKASEIAQKAYKENKTIKQVIKELNIKIKGDLDELLDPKKMI
ncbi:MAG: class II fumarate hydratase [Promethearchaeota archaeon]|nr:MAG: class II fumarate hydratase [Candidatus Lokiarchaeota archaeon]